MAIETFKVRIIYDDRNRDGWISKELLQAGETTSRVCFIANLDSTIDGLQPGQIWNASLVRQHEHYARINLTERLS